MNYPSKRLFLLSLLPFLLACCAGPSSGTGVSQPTSRIKLESPPSQPASSSTSANIKPLALPEAPPSPSTSPDSPFNPPRTPSPPETPLPAPPSDSPPASLQPVQDTAFKPEKSPSFSSSPRTFLSPSLGAGVSPDYRIGPGDVLNLFVLGEENMNKTYTVSANGLITLPLLGNIQAEGLTVSQLDTKITELLAKDYLVDPQVTVELVKFRLQRVSIAGAVRQPGSYELTGDSRVLNVLLTAGGPVSFNAELKILRSPQKDPEGKEDKEAVTPIILDLRKLFVEGDASQNIPLQDGDVLIVSEVKKKSRGASSAEGTSSEEVDREIRLIYVLGSVRQPGAYEYQEGDTVLDAILRAGGFTEYASRNGTKVVRDVDGKTETFKVKMKDVVNKGDRDKNPPIYPGDMIIIPESFF